MALETVSNLWGRTLNPFNRDLSAGGSSGGDAALVAMRGCPIAPSTDSGGSIRVPAAFNGLYAIRPTADRIPKGGMDNTNTGQMAFQLSCGPVCHSMTDLELLTQVINAHPRNKHDVTCAPIPWRNLGALGRKISIGIMQWDGVVMPHPPVLRALEHTRQTLEKAGHEGNSTFKVLSMLKCALICITVISFVPPFDCWDVSQTTVGIFANMTIASLTFQFGIYYPSGVHQILKTLETSGEPPIPVFSDLQKVYALKELSAAEALQVNSASRSVERVMLT